MSKSLRALFGGAAVMLSASGAYAVTLEASGATVDYLVLGNTGELSSFGADIDFAEGASVDDVELSFAVGLPLDGSSNGTAGGFDVTGAGGVSLDGVLSSVSSAEDVIELTFDDLGGPLAGIFGSSALLRIDFDDRLGTDAIGGLLDGNSYLTAITLTDNDQPGDGGPVIAPIPLPASGILMSVYLAMTGIYGFCRYRRSRKHHLPSSCPSLSARPI